jgi:molybdopterin-synthase adenylyltransferase
MQFKENLGIITEDQFNNLQDAKICIVGLGGLGGYIAHALVRFGFMHLMLVDDDVYEVSNLNRQMFSSYKTLNQSKVEITKNNLLEINPSAQITAHKKRIQHVSKNLLKGINLIVDATDDIQTKIDIEKYAKELNIPFCHGAVGGWYGQFGIFTPPSDIIETLYGTHIIGIESVLKSPTFAPAIIGNYMALHIIKFFSTDDTQINQLIQVDLKAYTMDVLYKKNGDDDGKS